MRVLQLVLPLQHRVGRLISGPLMRLLVELEILIVREESGQQC